MALPHAVRSPPEPASPELVARLREGDPAAFRSVYETHRARLYTFLLRLSRDEQLAADLSQETWLRLAANARRLTPETEPAAWLFRVARNSFVSHRRWARVHDAALALLRSGLPARHELEHSLHLSSLERALEALPLATREVVLLISIEGFTAPQVAAMLDVSPELVRQRLSRGRAALQRALEEEEDDA